MTDYTAAVIRLEDAYESMKLAKGRVANEIKARHRALQRREIEEATRELEYEFARSLALENANGLPGDIIRSSVLHTQDWSRWKKWRDLAGIAPERVSLNNAREAQKEAARLAEMIFEWVGNVLVVHRHPKTKEALPHPVKYPLHSAEGTHVPGTGMEEFSYLTDLLGDRKAGFELARAAYAEVKRAYADGEQTISTRPYDYVNDLPEGERMAYLEREEAKFFAANPWIDKRKDA